MSNLKCNTKCNTTNAQIDSLSIAVLKRKVKEGPTGYLCGSLDITLSNFEKSSKMCKNINRNFLKTIDIQLPSSYSKPTICAYDLYKFFHVFLHKLEHMSLP